jgi:hypothetical protein
MTVLGSPHWKRPYGTHLPIAELPTAASSVGIDAVESAVAPDGRNSVALGALGSALTAFAQNSHMDNLRLSLAMLAAVLSACSANSRWLEGALMSFKVEQTAPKTYLLTANGAGAQSRAQVERGFLVRASELCDNGSFDHTLQTVPYEYGDWNGTYIAQHSAYRTTGTVVCK